MKTLLLELIRANSGRSVSRACLLLGTGTFSGCTIALTWGTLQGVSIGTELALGITGGLATCATVGYVGSKIATRGQPPAGDA